MKKMLASTAILSLAGVLPALTADIGSPPVIYPPVFEEPVYHAPKVQASSGWYLRGDAGFAVHRLRGITYATGTAAGTSEASFTDRNLKSSFSVGAGVGYQINERFRSDLTLDYLASAKFSGATVGACGVGGNVLLNCTSTDRASFTAWSLLANAYVDLFTYGRVTAYVGAGLGATYVDWSGLKNTSCLTATPTTCDPTYTHAGGYGWAATAALMAGASVKITCGLAADVNYRYRYIAGGRMFGIAAGAGPGYTKGMHSHEGRAGLRYSFGGCADAYIPPYDPPTLPPVYK